MVRQVGGKVAVVCLVALLGLSGLARGAEFDAVKLYRELGLRFAFGKNTGKSSVHLYTLLPRWGIFFVRPGKQMGPFAASFIIEGVASIADAEQTGFELGFTPLLKLSCLLFPGVLVYLEGGAGLISESINSPALAHAFNFTPQAGLGVDIALTPQVALSVAYRFRHSSSAGIYKKNPAFNVNFLQAGLAYYY